MALKIERTCLTLPFLYGKLCAMNLLRRARVAMPPSRACLMETTVLHCTRHSRRHVSSTPGSTKKEYALPYTSSPTVPHTTSAKTQARGVARVSGSDSNDDYYLHFTEAPLRSTRALTLRHLHGAGLYFPPMELEEASRALLSPPASVSHPRTSMEDDGMSTSSARATVPGLGSKSTKSFVDTTTPLITEYEAECWKLDRLLLPSYMFFLSDAPPERQRSLLLPADRVIPSLGPRMAGVDRLYRRKGFWAPSEVAAALLPYVATFFVEYRYIRQHIPPHMLLRLEERYTRSSAQRAFFGYYSMLFDVNPARFGATLIKLNEDMDFVRNHPSYGKADRLLRRYSNKYVSVLSEHLSRQDNAGMSSSHDTCSSAGGDAHGCGDGAPDGSVRRGSATCGDNDEAPPCRDSNEDRPATADDADKTSAVVLRDADGGEGANDDVSLPVALTRAPHTSADISPTSPNRRPIELRILDIFVRHLPRVPHSAHSCEDGAEAILHTRFAEMPLVRWVNSFGAADLEVLNSVSQQRAVAILSRYVHIFQLTRRSEEDGQVYVDRKHLSYARAKDAASTQTALTHGNVSLESMPTLPSDMGTVKSDSCHVATANEELCDVSHVRDTKAEDTELVLCGSSYQRTVAGCDGRRRDGVGAAVESDGRCGDDASPTQQAGAPGCLDDKTLSEKATSGGAGGYAGQGGTTDLRCRVMDPPRAQTVPRLASDDARVRRIKMELQNELVGLDELFENGSAQSDYTPDLSGLSGPSDAVGGRHMGEGNDVGDGARRVHARDGGQTADEACVDAVRDATCVDAASCEPSVHFAHRCHERAMLGNDHQGGIQSCDGDGSEYHVGEAGSQGGVSDVLRRLETLYIRRKPPHIAARSLSNFDEATSPEPELVRHVLQLMHKPRLVFTDGSAHNTAPVPDSSPSSSAWLDVSGTLSGLWRWVPLARIYRTLSTDQRQQIQRYRGLARFLRLHGRLFELSLDRNYVILHDPSGRVAPLMPTQPSIRFEERVVLPSNFDTDPASQATYIGQELRGSFARVIRACDLPRNRSELALIDPLNPLLCTEVFDEELADILPSRPVRLMSFLKQMPPIMRAALPLRRGLVSNPHYTVFYEKGHPMIARTEASTGQGGKLSQKKEKPTMSGEEALQELLSVVPENGATVNALINMYLTSPAVDALVTHFGSVYAAVHALPQHLKVEVNSLRPKDSMIRVRAPIG